MPDTGYIQVHAYASNAQIPIKDAAVTITDAGASAIAMRLTNRNGQLDQPISIIVPNITAGQSPNTGIIPFTTVNLYARAENYEEIVIENLQVFPNIITTQDLEFIPLSELPGVWNKAEVFNIPAQNL